MGANGVLEDVVAIIQDDDNDERVPDDAADSVENTASSKGKKRKTKERKSKTRQQRAEETQGRADDKPDDKAEEGGVNAISRVAETDSRVLVDLQTEENS